MDIRQSAAAVASVSLGLAATATACVPAPASGNGGPTPRPTASTSWVTVTAAPVTVTPTPTASRTVWATVTAAPVTVPAPSPARSISPATRPGPTTGRSPSSALEALSSLPVRPPASGVGYSREEFGQKYADVDRNGCDTRNDALRRDLREVVLKPASRGCVVAAGVLTDPYGGRTIQYERGASSRTDFEHVVSLADAWRTGAQALTPAERTRLANDPLNVLMVDAGLNRSKGEGAADAWLPPVQSYRCPYVARQIAVKATYRLWVTPGERTAMEQVLATCPRQPLPTPAQVAFPPLAH